MAFYTLCDDYLDGSVFLARLSWLHYDLKYSQDLSDLLRFTVKQLIKRLRYTTICHRLHTFRAPQDKDSLFYLFSPSHLFLARTTSPAITFP